MQSLERLRWRLTAWYVATFGAILLAFSVGLFFAISHNIAMKLDRSAARAASEIERSVVEAAGDGRSPRIVRVVRHLRIPDRSLYLFDTTRELVPDTASAVVRRAAEQAMGDGEASMRADIGHEHTLLLHALRFAAPDGRTLIAVATADTEELEDEYARLITIVAVCLGASLILVGLGGYVLARRSTDPVERSFEQMRRFMADAAHELRTPVAFLRARADLTLEQARSATEYASALSDVSAGAERLSTIVDDLFTLARADAGERRVERELVYLDDIVLEAARDARTLATARGVRVDVPQFDETPTLGDPRLLLQLAHIIIDNAIKYTPRGGSVTLRVGPRDGRAGLTIADTGIGIAAEELPRIFDRFYRATGARSTAEGAGLGLSIAAWIVEAHGGRIDVESAIGVGTTFAITLPMTAEPAAAQSGAIMRPDHGVTVP